MRSSRLFLVGPTIVAASPGHVNAIHITVECGAMRKIFCTYTLTLKRNCVHQTCVAIFYICLCFFQDTVFITLPHGYLISGLTGMRKCTFTSPHLPYCAVLMVFAFYIAIAF